MHRQTNVKTVCTDVAFLAMPDLLEIELSSHAHEDEEEKRRQKSANVAIAASAAAGKGSSKSFVHPPTVGRCLRCESTEHAVAECKRPRQEKTAFPCKGKGN